MYLIPQSWPHLHILISVFPSIGFAIVLGVYVAGLRAGNDFTRRTCLAVLGALGILSIPILVSGVLTASSGNSRFSQEMLSAHYRWGIGALIVLALTGAFALFELWRVWRARRPPHEPFGLILGLASVTLILTVVADEFGWRINHRELETAVTIPDISTSQLWSHAHIILNHVPTAGFVFTLAFFAAALVANNDVLKRSSLALFVICSVFGVPTYVAGTAAMWALTQPEMPGISKAMIDAHRDMALWTLFGLAFTGAASWIELWRARSRGHFSQRSLKLVLLFAVITLGIMTETGHLGGLIDHPEIRVAADTVRGNADVGISATLEVVMKERIWFLIWQVVHFFGYCLIFGTVTAVAARVLGFWKPASFAAMHQLLLLGFLGVLMNVFSGMLMMLADSYTYVVSDSTFAPKIALILIGSVAALYFSLSTGLWNVKAGEEAPWGAKCVAALVLLAWAGVIVCGRLLPYL